MHTIKVTTIGDSIEIVLPKKALEHMHIADGEQLQVIETANGVELTNCNEEFVRQLEIAEKIMFKRHEVLRKLAE